MKRKSPPKEVKAYPCPICGKDAVLVDQGDIFYLTCGDRHHNIEIGPYRSEGLVIKEWNKFYE